MHPCLKVKSFHMYITKEANKASSPAKSILISAMTANCAIIHCRSLLTNSETFVSLAQTAKYYSIHKKIEYTMQKASIEKITLVHRAGIKESYMYTRSPSNARRLKKMQCSW